ncbi:AER343Cp [Eremothecium gossypii ATCC 10895]|uniref:Protein EFR3 n=1 Tax=Eremothecium gossypii (strain ATCC 10895 / CBS 109.51 / FGSC 9923 / NRRL Y-1056) TaxID=284811 RepID=EFR3_EREGS|nr:AER343Cp [Eremothecium gossypii ATCC 10895]Q756C4.2 RecName: Full=Protein EFR3 [Eremothecium gossypii ATCC 10895]AAS53023.2 AER343Cp [Eremothecium gossypii ATCC 10895]AEY97331.1 FAER343Cp [Eremothecium gossypii FDAG1]
MGLLFTPKHQKLVNQCYPTGRTPDKKPKSSETSYLLYYVNSRRTKLEKVSAYLVKRTAADLAHRRIGNVMVTLELAEKIVTSCKENLNVFVKEFLDIMIKTLSNNNFNLDVCVVEAAEAVFSSICQHLDGVLCNSDLEFTQMYRSFVDVYCQVVTERLHNDELLMKGCLDISKTANLAGNPGVSSLISRGVELTLAKFQEVQPRFQGESLQVDLHSSEKRLSRSQTHLTAAEESRVLGGYPEQALQSYFSTTETDKLSIAIRALIKRLLEVPNKELLQYIANTIPVQLRYILVLVFTHALNQEDEHAVVLLKLMTTLLVSDVSIIGLSVLDLLRKIINFQLASATSPQVTEACTNTISALNRKTYYKDQPIDMISELLLKLKEHPGQREKDILISDLQAVLQTVGQPFMTLELFLELAPYVPDRLELFSLVTDKLPGGFVMNKFFLFLVALESPGEQEKLLDDAFAKYKNFTLLSGLIYFLEEGNTPSNLYYCYHTKAARFLEFDDYHSQAQYKRQEREIFTRNDLVNYYSDPGCNRYAEKGLRILISQNTRVSTTDLTETPPEGELQIPDIPLPPTPPTPQQHRMFLNSDASVKSLDKMKSPKVSDLKRAARGIRVAPSHSSLRASQSVKSRVTNITFLLNELNNESQETGIYDPEEEEVVGLEKTDLARSISAKVSPAIAYSSKRFGNLTSSLDLELQEDAFQDASGEIEASSAFRGKLFSS